MRLAIIGGSFNPLHIGHAMLADTMIKERRYDKILFIPTCVPPHKQLSGGITTEQRVGMVKAFCESVPGNVFECETCEIDRGGVSYTVDTLEYIVKKYDGELEGKPALLMGSEMASEFYKWYKPQRIVELADITIVPRYPDILNNSGKYKNKPSGAYAGDFKTEFDKDKFGFDFVLLEDPMVPVSSTQIRTRVSEGKSFEYLVPAAVYKYIVNNQLYKKGI